MFLGETRRRDQHLLAVVVAHEVRLTIDDDCGASARSRSSAWPGVAPFRPAGREHRPENLVHCQERRRQPCARSEEFAALHSVLRRERLHSSRCGPRPRAAPRSVRKRRVFAIRDHLRRQGSASWLRRRRAASRDRHRSGSAIGVLTLLWVSFRRRYSLPAGSSTAGKRSPRLRTWDGVDPAGGDGESIEPTQDDRCQRGARARGWLRLRAHYGRADGRR